MPAGPPTLSTIDTLRGRVADALAETLWPTRCAGCGVPGTLLCDACAAALPWIEQADACPVCGAPYGSLACTACRKDWEVPAVAAMGFEGTPARIVRIYKDGHETRLAALIAAAIATALDEAAGCSGADGRPRADLSRIDALAFIPSTSTAYLRRGFDPMELVCAHLSRFLDIPVADVLLKADALDQRGLGREERRRNLAGTVELREDVAGMGILVVDDVATTGASLAAAAQALASRGAAAVAAAVFARVW